MERRSIEAIVRTLNEARVRYLIVGGLAVVAHGHLRLTADLDLVLDLDEKNLSLATRALSGLGYRPRAPVPIDEYCLPAKRAEWVRDKGMTVFSLSSDRHPATEVDLFLEEPFDFGTAYTGAAHMEVAPSLPATFVGREDLIRMKERAGRPQDLDDIAKLRALGRGE